MGPDGRTWSLRSNREWSTPRTGGDFEHEVDGGRGGSVLVLSALLLFWAILLSWAPAEVHVPWWLQLDGILVVTFFLVRWYRQRPWTVVAETLDSADGEPEHWSAVVRGAGRARTEMRIAARSINSRATPDDGFSSLQRLV